ncbi:hypothetical protein KGM_207997 [Danaus plexippus plexippus]|uniref:Uncharacterized protein n=1 Tax=Danaus plexippus plexippus TaxID=278856 RepID=A0A212EZY6_DANPL|nr:hypothetical protein KGM_207997 [Danaus plexippus plexippus]
MNFNVKAAISCHFGGFGFGYPRPAVIIGGFHVGGGGFYRRYPRVYYPPPPPPLCVTFIVQGAPESFQLNVDNVIKQSIKCHWIGGYGYGYPRPPPPVIVGGFGVFGGGFYRPYPHVFYPPPPPPPFFG